MPSQQGCKDSSALAPDDEDLDFGAEIQMTAAVSGVVPDDTFSVTHAVDAIGFGKFQVKLSFATGLCWMADSMEMMILSILSPALQCEWGLSRYEQALITTFVFLGMMVSSAFWGKLSDKFGRRQGLFLSAVFLFYYGFLSSFAPTFTWMLFLRFLVGTCIGCVPQAVTLYSEFLPTKQRAKCVVLLDCFWSLGACFEVLLALFVMPTLGWRWLLALSSLPLLLFVIVCGWLPESPRYHAASGQTEKAVATLQQVAKTNDKPMLLGRLIVDDIQFERGRISDLLVRELRRTTLSLWFIWATCSFVYYGVVLMSTELFDASVDLCSTGKQVYETCSASCHPLQSSDYVYLLWTTLAEFPGIMFTVFIIEKLGRKQTMALEFVLFSASLCFLYKCSSNRTFLTVVLFFARGLASGVFQAAYVYTPEVYPTILRAIGVGSCSGMARFGAMVTPYIAQVLMKSSLTGAITVYGLVSLAAAVACFFLPIETKGKDLKDSVGQ